MSDVFFSTRYIPLIFPIDKEGYIHPLTASITEISMFNKGVLDDIYSCCNSLMGEKVLSIYFRGSQLIEKNESDFDIVIVIDDDVEQSEDAMARRLNDVLRPRYYHIRYFDVLVIKRSEINFDRHLQFIVKILCVRSYGISFEDTIPGFKLGKESIFLLPRLQHKIEEFLNHLHSKDKEYRVSLSSYIIKYLIRCCLELVMERKGVYSRDIHVCREMFLQYYPAKQEELDFILEYYEKQTYDYSSLAAAVGRLSGFLCDEYHKIYGS